MAMKFKAQIITIVLLSISSLSVISLLFYYSRIKPIEISERPLILASFLYESGENDLVKKQREKNFQSAESLYRIITGDSEAIDMTEDVSAFKYADRTFSFAFPLEQFIATADLSQEVNNNNFSYSRALEDRSTEKYVYVDQEQNYDLYFKTKKYSDTLTVNGEKKSAVNSLSDWRMIDNYSSGENNILSFKSADQDDQIVEVVLVVDNKIQNKSSQRENSLNYKNGIYFFDFGDEDYTITHNPKNIFLSPISCNDDCENPKFISYYPVNNDNISFEKKSMNIITKSGYYRLNNYNFSRSLLMAVLVLFFYFFLILLIINKDFKESVAHSLAGSKYVLEKFFSGNKIQISKIIILNLILFVLRFISIFRPYLSMTLIILINVFLLWWFLRSKKLLSVAAILFLLLAASLNSLFLFENLAEKLAIGVVFLIVFILLESLINLVNGSRNFN
jgi:hypothetical protein